MAEKTINITCTWGLSATFTNIESTDAGDVEHPVDSAYITDTAVSLINKKLSEGTDPTRDAILGAQVEQLALQGDSVQLFCSIINEPTTD
jgi:hypothetical protein